MARVILNSGWVYDYDLSDLFGDYESTRWLEFAEDDVIYGKLAYCPKNSAMHEYDIDWIMPEINDTVYDTEYYIPEYATYHRVLCTLKDWEDGMKEIVEYLGLEV